MYVRFVGRDEGTAVATFWKKSTFAANMLLIFYGTWVECDRTPPAAP